MAIEIKTVKDSFGWLHNMSPHMVVYRNQTFKTAEHLFQWLRFQEHPNVQSEIFKEASPLAVKMKAREHRKLLNRGDKWDEADKDIPWMKLCFVLKLKNNPNLVKELIKTGDKEIIEDCTTHDKESARFWGAEKKNNNWVGENWIGKLWMELRDVVKKHPSNYEFWSRSSLQKSFHYYFPEVDDIDVNQTEAEIKIKLGKNPITAKITDSFFIEFEVPKRFIEALRSSSVTQRLRSLPYESSYETLSMADLLIMFEGLDYKRAHSIFQQLLNGQINYSLDDYKLATKDLWDPKGQPALDKLKSDFLLTESTIKTYEFGYDEKTNEIVLPIKNYMSTSLAGVVRFSIEKEDLHWKYDGIVDLFGYHELMNSTIPLGYLFLTYDFIDALLLRQIGYSAVGPIDPGASYPYSIFSRFNLLVFDFATANEFHGRALSTGLIKSPCEKILDLQKQKNYTQEDYDRLISKKQGVTTQFLENHKNLRAYSDIARVDKYQFPQFYHNGILYFGVNPDRQHFLSSAKTLGSPVGLIVETSPDNKCHLSPGGIDKFLIQRYSPKPASVFNSIKKLLADYIYFSKAETYDVITVWIMGTYLFSIFGAYPYLHIQAPKGSGKSTLLQYMEKLCFNGRHWINPSASVVFREIALHKLTALFDEVEGYGSKASRSDIIQILNSGYSNHIATSRVSGTTVEYFDLYSPKAFAGIGEIGDTLSSRVIKIDINKKPSSAVLKRYLDNKITKNRFDKIRDEAYLFALQFAKEIEDEYLPIENLPELSDIENREFQLWAPLFSIAKVVSRDKKHSTLLQKFRIYLEYNRGLIIDQSKHDDHKLMQAFFKFIRENSYLKTVGNQFVYSRSDVFNYLDEINVLPTEVKTVHKLTSFLKDQFGIESKVVDIKGNKERHYLIDPELIITRLKKYGISLTKEDFKK